ncbi:MAG TPA: glycosyltransferase [Bacteroidota bacterium]|nr:glycosyltransferase [Bacteroidota bacterium]
MSGPSVLVSADWDRLTDAQKGCLRSVARATLGWGFRWGNEFKAEFSVRTSHPEALPSGVAMYNLPQGQPLREPSVEDIVVFFLSPQCEPPLAEAMRAASRGAVVLMESHPLAAERFKEGAIYFTSPDDLAEKIYLLLENPGELTSQAGRGSMRVAALKRPFVSIILFTYNGARYLGEAIQSALSQRYDYFEVLVVDDGSTDGTEALVREIASSRLRYIRQEHAGAPAARNRGILEANGEFIVWLGADDVLERDCLASQVRVLGGYPLADVVYGNVMICDAGLGDQRLVRYEEWYGRNREIPRAMVRTNVIPDGGTLIRKECYRRIGTYDTEFRRAHDYQWWSRLADRAVFKHNDAALYRWRWHGGNLGAGSGRQVDMSFESRIVEGLIRRYGLEELFPDPAWKKGNRKRAAALAHAKVAEILAGYGDSAGALAHIQEGEKTLPLPEIRRAIQAMQQKVAKETGVMAKTSVVDQAVAGNPREAGSPVAARGRLSVTYLITSILGVTGGNMTLLRQANALVRRGHRVSIVTRSARPSWFDISAEVICVPGNDPMWRYVPPSDVVISTYFMNAAELASVSAPVKIYFAQGDQFVFDDACRSSRPDLKKLHAVMKEASRISYLLPGVRFVANSRALASRVEELYGRKADALLPVCVDQDVFAPGEKSLPGGVPRILIVGPDEAGTDLEPLSFKGIAETRKALELLAESGEKFAAVRISNTPPSIFRGFPAEFHVAPPDEGKRMLFGSADILIYASHYDSCPRPPLEAMASGAAVVCTDTAGAREYCRDGENALLVPAGSPDEIAGAVRRLIHDDALRQTLVSGGAKTAALFPQEREWNELERLLIGFAGKGDDPDFLSRQMRQAALCMEQGDPSGALASALGAREAAARGGAAPSMICGIENFIGICTLGQGDLESAKEAFSRALEADNSSSRACTGLGDVFRMAGLPDEARTMYEWGLKNDPANEQARKGLLALGSAKEAPGEDITAVHADSQFARTIRDLFARVKPKKILETGTFMGTGTTAVIAGALKECAINDARFYSIEVNPGLHGLARQNLERAGLLGYVTLLNGLSVPRSLLPTKEDIEKRTVHEAGNAPLYVDHAVGERVEKYFMETDFPDVAEDLLGRVLGVFGAEPDFVLLDSGGHMGNVEFKYLLGKLKGPCYLMLDDINHVKHHASFVELSADPRFEVITAMNEKAGFCLARFTPAPEARHALAAPSGDLGARMAAAQDLFGRKRFAEALGALEGAEEMISGIPEGARETAASGLETFRGMSHLGLSDLDSAKASFERALKIRPDSTHACAGLGEVLYLAGLDSDAKVMFEHAVALEADNAFGAAGLAKVNAVLGLPAAHNTLTCPPGGSR